MNNAPPPPEVIYIDTPQVACDGGEGPLGHPRVYLKVGASGKVECGYCDRLYILKGGPADEQSNKAA
ncbi:zinc-finger domain-containing protein [Pedomonas sp. V897]|uniref:zinc-finger domain-containing protein n=1 Tax=Pedomonas sp. V897 TaxID=3446482 RepID=UPI003EE38F10